ncbi:hypothetical protein AGMMS50262_04280 [Bacteroidia bacterium]|nr:hypothetical protein AGMMS50262_04280 [Bacteroidia bacterium]
MKKPIALLFLFMIAGITQAQQAKFQPEWAFGGNAGATFSKMRFYPNVPQDMLTQATIGLTARYISESNFGLQVELNYAQRGWKERTDTLLHLNEYSRRIDYLELPVMTHIYFNLGSRVRLVFNLGPQIGFQIGNKNNSKKVINTPDGSYDSYYDKPVERPFDYGIAGGGGLEIRTGLGRFVLEGRYYFGLSDAFNNGKSDPFQSSGNQVLTTKLTYFYRTR